MTPQQIGSILMILHSIPKAQRINRLTSEIKHLGIPADDYAAAQIAILNDFNRGIKHLNANQLKNIFTQVQVNGLQKDEVEKKLFYYEVDKEYHERILNFLVSYVKGDNAIKVEDWDTSFTGVQVASRDDFNNIINQGWTGDWEMNPSNIKTNRVQIASLNETGLFPRGYYLNADIVKIEPVVYPTKKRYRIFIANPQIINSGDRNVKFIAQPVRYI